MKKYYNFETNDKNLKDKLSYFLKENDIYYELSDCMTVWHFEILCNTEEASKVNDWLDAYIIAKM